MGGEERHEYTPFRLKMKAAAIVNENGTSCPENVTNRQTAIGIISKV